MNNSRDTAVEKHERRMAYVREKEDRNRCAEDIWAVIEQLDGKDSENYLPAVVTQLTWIAEILEQIEEKMGHD